MNRLVLAIAVAALAHVHAAFAATELQFWHSMNGAAGEEVNALAEKFNALQHAYRVVPEFKGSDEASLAAGIAAFASGKAPHILQVSDSGTAAMMEARRAVLPLYRLMAEAGEKFDPRAYMPAVASIYSDSHGKLMSLPFDSSTAVFYYNKDAFRRAGVDPNQAPRTWFDVQAAALKLRESEATPCAYTTDWQSWVLVENLSAWHNEPIATRDNGFGGGDAKLNFNAELLVRHIGLMSSWVKSGLFTYAGRGSEGETKFASGECAMVTSSSSAYTGIARSARFEFAVSPLPYYDEFRGAPFNTIVRGASLWVPAGKKRAEYKGVAAFFSFLSRPEVQADWYQRTGYLPNTVAAYDLIKARGDFDARPGSEVAMKDLGRETAAHSRGLRLGSFTQIRAMIDEELEAVWSQKKTPKEALDSAVERGNALLSRIERDRRKR